jgi:hypothetical protein
LTQINCACGVAHDIHGVRSGPCWRQDRVEFLPGSSSDCGRDTAEFDQPIDGKTPMPPPLVRMASRFPEDAQLAPV